MNMNIVPSKFVKNGFDKFYEEINEKTQQKTVYSKMYKTNRSSF